MSDPIQTRRIVIKDGPPGRKSVHLDGQEITNAIRGLNYRTDGTRLPEIELDLLVIDAATYADPAKVVIPSATRDLLVELGWTPPEGDTDAR